MTHETIDTLVIGGGQAGISMSHHLTAQGIPHLVLEKNRIAESWHTARWDSLVANGPAWHDRVPPRTFEDVDGEAFAPKDRVADYFEALATQIKVPIRCGVAVQALTKTPDGFRAGRDQLDWEDLKWLRDQWPGKLLVKGVMHSEDARLATRLGVDAIIVSNHGGRQLDGAISLSQVAWPS